MATTSISLLERVRNPLDTEAWTRFSDIYTPLLLAWGLRRGLNRTSAEDLVQDILVKMVKELPTFEYDTRRSFRAWLKTITVRSASNILRDSQRRPQTGVDSAIRRETEGESEVDLLEKEEHNAFVINRVLEMLRPEFSEKQFRALELTTREGKSAAEAAAELQTSVNSVYLAKSRIIKRAREEAEGLLDE